MTTNETYDAKITALITNENLSLLQKKIQKHKTLPLESVESLIFLFFLVSETFGRSCSVFLIQMANFMDNPTILQRLKTFQAHQAGSRVGKHANRYLLNFVVLRQLLRSKKLLNAGGMKKVESIREERKKLTRYMIDSLEDPNFLRGYAVIRYVIKNDRLLLQILKSILLKTVDREGNHVFEDVDGAPYFEQQKDGEVPDIADSISPIRNLREELCSTSGIELLKKCCTKFEDVWFAASEKL